MKTIRALAVAAIMTLGASAWAGTATGEDASERGFAYADPVAGAWAPVAVMPAAPIENRMRPAMKHEIGMQTVPVQNAHQINFGATAAKEIGSTSLDGQNLPPRQQNAPLIVPLPSAAEAGFMMLGIFVLVRTYRRIRAAIGGSRNQ